VTLIAAYMKPGNQSETDVLVVSVHDRVSDAILEWSNGFVVFPNQVATPHEKILQLWVSIMKRLGEGKGSSGEPAQNRIQDGWPSMDPPGQDSLDITAESKHRKEIT